MRSIVIRITHYRSSFGSTGVFNLQGRGRAKHNSMKMAQMHNEGLTAIPHRGTLFSVAARLMDRLYRPTTSSGKVYGCVGGLRPC
jgi:hypothetical protein